MKFKKECILVLGVFLSLLLIPLVNANIVISEVMWNHDTSSNCEYIEVYNNGASSVDLSLWQTQPTSTGTWRAFDDLTISAGEHIIIAQRLTGNPSFETCYGNGDGTWNSGDGDYQAVDGTIAFASLDNIVSIRDENQVVQSTFNYGTSYGANGNGNSLHLLGNNSISAGTETPGEDSGIDYCGDGTCNAGETCSSCSADCLTASQVCCSGTAYTGDCCNTEECGEHEACLSHICTAVSYCGDGVCNANESCSNCFADCLTASQVCCSDTAYTGNCCENANCDANQICTNHICTAAPYCGNGFCDANESCSNCSADCTLSATQCCAATSANADSHGRVNSTYTTTAGKICCSGTDYTGTCCNDAECSSPNVCESHQCVAPYTATCTALSCTCDLSLILTTVSSFTGGTSGNYYLSVRDLKSNYTGSATVTHWVENSSGYITSHSPANLTLSLTENRTVIYAPNQNCGNLSQTIKAKIANFGCNDTTSSNDEANRAIVILGQACTISSTTTSITTPKTTTAEEPAKSAGDKIIYNIEVPQRLEVSAGEKVSSGIEKNFTLKINVENQESTPKTFEVWSYIYLDDSCYSCLNNSTKESNKQIVGVEAESEGEVDLSNLFIVPQEGDYKIKVMIQEVGSDEIKEFDYDIQVGGESKVETKESVGEQKETYETKNKTLRLIGIVLLLALLSGAIVFVKINYTEQIIGFKDKIIGFIQEKRREFQRKKDWQEHIEGRRGKGILQRLDKGFLKKREDGK